MITGAKIIKCNSIYTWKEKEIDKETYLIIFDAKSRNKKTIVQSIKQVHPYDVPAITVFKMNYIDKDYASFLNK